MASGAIHTDWLEEESGSQGYSFFGQTIYTTPDTPWYGHILGFGAEIIWFLFLFFALYGFMQAYIKHKDWKQKNKNKNIA